MTAVSYMDKMISFDSLNSDSRLRVLNASTHPTKMSPPSYTIITIKNAGVLCEHINRCVISEPLDSISSVLLLGSTNVNINNIKVWSRTKGMANRAVLACDIVTLLNVFDPTNVYMR